MQSNNLLNRIILVAVFTAFIFSFASLVYSIKASPHQENLTSPIKNTIISQKSQKLKEQIVFGLPVRIRIPSINVDAVVEQVGVTSKGAMGVPKGPDNTAWYSFGPRPGEIGNAVIAGHYGWKNGIAAAFDHVNELRKGDKISVKDVNGVDASFVVRELRMYDQNENASSVFISTDGKSHLVLVTCEGVWNKALKSYSGRLVVFADKE